MSPKDETTRSQVHEIVIDAPIEAVWKAIADGEELTRWFVESASVEPGVGGTIEISWGGPEKGLSHIEVWEPNRTLRVALKPFDGIKPLPAGPIIDEYTIERREGKTVLRLVSSGIPATPDWDGFYDGTSTGWPSFFRTLRHYLEHHRGKPRQVIKVVGMLSGSPEDGWAQLTGANGLNFAPVSGEAFDARIGTGERLHGRVAFAKAPNQLDMSISEIDEAFLAHTVAGGGGKHFVYTMLSVYGKSPEEVEAIRARWQPWLTGAIGVAVSDASAPA
jgi:uncharacterized protein YndB with AHSA1/START domain